MEFERKWFILLILSFIAAGSFSKEILLDKMDMPDVTSVTFLIVVNNSWQWVPPFDNSTYLCVVTVKSDPLTPNTPLNKTGSIVLGNCDKGPLVFSIRSDEKGHTFAVPVFHSTSLEPVYPPTCTIDWNYSYRLPTQNVAEESLLPGCSTSSTGGPAGIQTVSYLFYVLDWELSSRVKNVQNNPTQDISKNKVVSMTFLVAVNQTETNCLMTSKTVPLKPGVLHNQTAYIYVGKCDYGALDFNITTSTDVKGKVHSSVDLVFHSHDIEDASPPTCKISWDYSYKVPSEKNFHSSLLPGCYTEESREGFHMTYYWFYVLDWVLAEYTL